MVQKDIDPTEDLYSLDPEAHLNLCCTAASSPKAAAMSPSAILLSYM